MRQIEHQTQNLIDSCVSTCVAMLAGVPASEVEQKFHALYHAGGAPIEMMLAAYGVSCTKMYTDDDVVAGHVYMVLTCSLAQPGRFHMVILDARSLDNCRVYDPAKGFVDGEYHTSYYYWPEDEPPEHKAVQLGAFIPVVRIKGEEWNG